MFFELHNVKKGLIKSISIDISKLDKSVCDHLMEYLRKNIKTENGKVIIKTDMTLDELKTLNDGYNQFHSQFIIENIIKNKESVPVI